MNKSYKIIVFPSTQDERDCEELDTYIDAFTYLNQGHGEGVELFEFATEAERSAFIKGYQAMVGYMGDGAFVQNVEQPKYVVVDEGALGYLQEGTESIGILNGLISEGWTGDYLGGPVSGWGRSLRAATKEDWAKFRVVMGVLKDLGTSVVDSVDAETLYSVDEYGRYLDKFSPITGELVPDWDKVGTELYNMTNAYGHLHYGVGTSDGFTCMDYAVLLSDKGNFIILESVYNTETGGSIHTVSYELYPINTDEDRRMAYLAAEGIVRVAEDGEEGVDEEGWNQEPHYFSRSVARQLFPALSIFSYDRLRWVNKNNDTEVLEALKGILE